MRSVNRLFLTLLLMMPATGWTATVVGIVSERSAAELAAGAHRFLDNHPEHEVVLRTPEQLSQVSDSEMTALLTGADAILLAAVFGEQVQRLAEQLSATAGVPVMALNGDQRLTRMSRLDGRRIMADLDSETVDELVAAPEPGESPREHLRNLQTRFVDQAAWLEGRAYFQGRTPRHMDGLLRWLLNQAGHELALDDPQPRAAIRYYQPGTDPDSASADAEQLELETGPAVAIMDLDSGDRPGDKALLDQTCAALEQRGIQCFAVLANWGGATVEAVRQLPEIAGQARLSAVLSLQDFILGGGDGRREVTEELAALDIPVLKGIRLVDRNEDQWRLSHDGMPADTVHYQLAMPELQGISQPMVMSTAAPATIDEITGVALKLSRPVEDRVKAMADRLQRWQQLQELDNSDKRIALVYYNHPPGRQNVGADNLDVPASLLEMLTWLKDAGYTTGELPESPDELLERILDRGVNMPEDRQALEAMKGQVPSLNREAYQSYFETLPDSIRAELENGPLGYLHSRLEQAHQSREIGIAHRLLTRGINDIRHLLENHEHSARPRALDLLDQYESGWQRRLDEDGALEPLDELLDALTSTGIAGLSGWGEPPGRSMVTDGEMIFPGLRFGNIVLAPQPPRGWELDESLLHANTTFPPTHQYVGFYHWLRDHFEADALVYTGRHSTREFLPHRRAGLTGEDYPDLLGGDLPVIYPYIVDGVGEGIQAKRRAMGVMISHLTPPLATTELYDDLLEMRQLVETHEAALEPDSPSRERSLAMLREHIENLELTGEFEREIANELGAPAEEVSLDDISDDLLVHEAGHYLTDMQERFMPLGLHVFGRDWDEEALDTMLESMADSDSEPDPQWRKQLEASPAQERENWLAALDGRFVPPGKGNDPVRTPEVLPTGRNFHALSSDLIPTRVAWSLGTELANEARSRTDGGNQGSEALVLWASDTVRDEGVMIAFGLNMLGIKPSWNSRGIVNGLERLPLGTDEGVTQRRDVLFTTSGLFRDLYGDQLEWLDEAVRVALQGAATTIREQHPQLRPALEAALSALPEDMNEPGRESLENNRVAARWVADTRRLLASGSDAEQAGEDAALRVFGTAPGAYGAGVNRLASRSGAWQERGELARAYQRRMGHSYGSQSSGEPAQEAFRQRLSQVGRSYLGRASHLYGLLDNNDGFDFQGGLSNAVEQLRGEAPDNRILQYANPDNPRVESLERALLGELRARNLNPQWLRPLMDHGYSGARTMGSDFLDNLWGWQVTSPDVVRSGVWDEVNAVYFEDRHDLGLDEFLTRENNIHVKTHMQAIMLLSAQRDYWEADTATLDAMAREFARAVVENGLPGSGHTRPDHPLLDWVAQRLEQPLQQEFQDLRDMTQVEQPQSPQSPDSIREVRPETEQQQQSASEEATPAESGNGTERPNEASGEGGNRVMLPTIVALLGLSLLLGGIARGRRIR